MRELHRLHRGLVEDLCIEAASCIIIDYQRAVEFLGNKA